MDENSDLLELKELVDNLEIVSFDSAKKWQKLVDIERMLRKEDQEKLDRLTVLEPHLPDAEVFKLMIRIEIYSEIKKVLLQKGEELAPYLDKEYERIKLETRHHIRWAIILGIALILLIYSII